jgi:ABC-2 type transport system permease protein
VLSSVFTKAIRDRWAGLMIGSVLVAVWLVLAMAIYRDIDISVYTELPEGVRDLMGIPEGADAATLAYNIMLESAAALTLAGLAVSMGSAAIAGEERNGTFGLLLGNPKTRTQILASKLAAMIMLIAAATMFLWGTAELAPLFLDVDIGDTYLGAMHLHLGVNAVFYGIMAFVVGASTGNRTMASAIPAAVMVISYFATGLLPLVDPVAGLARAFPWYYFSSSDPLVTGSNWGHLAVLITASVALGTAAFVGLNHRDLRGTSVGVSFLDRLRNNAHTARIFERLAGSTRVSRIWIKTTSDHQPLLFITAGVMFVVMGVLMGPMYVAIEDDIAAVGEDFPEALLALAGDGDLTTPEGWFQVETFSLMAPIAIMVVAVVIGARAVAGEEANRTMGLLLANPIRRSSVVLEKALAMIVYAAAVGLSIFGGVAIANLISDLDMSYGGIAATSLLVTLLGLAFGALALALGAATGSTKIATYGAVVAAATSHLLNSFLPLSDNLAGWARATPHHYFLANDPLNNGMHWGHAALLAAVTAALIATAVSTFDHRDLRQG